MKYLRVHLYLALLTQFICVDASSSGSYIHVIAIIVRVFPMDACTTIYLAAVQLIDT